MTIYLGSRYENSTVDFFNTSPDGDQNVVVFGDIYFYETLSFSEHVFVDGEKLSNIANDVYNKPDRWWLILDNNPQIVDPFNIPVGTVLRIPNA